ncbi:hypothetical protein NOF04DRAFT_7567 [Fusarium oxysporum II5]|uniref:Malate dehydrogenase n=3 Tax=Fusarium oxysporum species complex TaxID=171631 RepID=N4U3V1_FUSC1|nr:uncharacterized protein FOIG_16801 [Fusarium odoratissimum NRRL 54006]ENH66057.1 hypothetical protein FOC1_g10001965 [Fusarium oxysporum f. sp. cubense race 1]KAK2122286.1 hypothetical protein NOF04DRAFT_7567 [Fusarium oxysporum II5]TVY74559.1 hypothetical protein Focb16_v005743 [Fusarium oxysporum f. sp. cubense]EXL89918.1 hypothetical protein FOIG_16801 [Fusarium odoratissimum NRRL 54006]TXB98014.1 hypothetical protein FocTR4_00016998 [Fusarium oxysporum f. sp. cubense]
MLARFFFALTSAALALASPPVHNLYPSQSGMPTKPTPVLPSNGGDSELPEPSEGVSLKHIALGFGIQNYTCADTAAGPTPVGALAVLYDVTHLYPGQGHSSLTQDEWASLPGDILDTLKVPLNLNEKGTGASLVKPFRKKQDLKIRSLSKKIPYLGHHYFNAAGVPTFDLDKARQLLVAKKIGDIKAPASSLAGPEGTGAVNWLFLGDAGGSHGISYAYRVLTAGGASHGCKAKGADSTSYTAMYWFYN